MNINVFLLLHIAVCASLLCWIVTMFSVLRFFSASRAVKSGGQQGAPTDGLKDAVHVTVRWGTAFALVDLAAHVLAWLYSLSALGGSPLDSLFLFACISFLGGIAGMVISTFAMLGHMGTSSACVGLLRIARRLPLRLVVIGLLSIATLAFLSF